MKKVAYLVSGVPLFMCVACLVKGALLLINGDDGSGVMGWWFGSVFALLVTMMLASLSMLHGDY